jgi:long-chain acyl-CoA synthetase
MAEVRPWADREGLAGVEGEDLACHPTIRALVQSIVDEKNRELPRFEQIKKFAVLPADFSQETGELTPTLKVKRKVVSQKYADRIEALYAAGVADA